MYLTFAPTRTLNFNLSRFYPVDLAIRYIAMADCKKDCSSNDGADKSEQFTVVYIHCAELMKESDKNPRVCGRGTMVHSLIESYGLLNKLQIIKPSKATDDDIIAFHSSGYLDFLKSHKGHEWDDLSPEDMEEAEVWGLGYDCPLFEGVYDYARWMAGGSLAAARCLVQGGAQVAINWYGGWHHAMKDEASGFCYCNDIVLAILHLLDHFDRVLYIDIDIHHGDGVEAAFNHSSRVMTLSLHKFSPGFFPGTGDISSTSSESGSSAFCCCNIPLQDGLRDEVFNRIFKRIADDVYSCFEPDVVVLQCGADMLSGDPIGTFSLTPHGLSQSVCSVLRWGLPTLLLGGGGYHFSNTARFWTLCTALALGEALPSDIPEHRGFENYGPDFTLHVSPGNRQDENSDKSVKELIETIAGNLSNVRPKQSSQT